MQKHWFWKFGSSAVLSNKRHIYRVRRIYGNIISVYNWIYLISCHNCCCRYILSLTTSILHFRSLNYINKIISMAIDRKTMVNLHKKGESNSIIAKELHIRRETVWKVIKKFRETGQISNRPGQGRKRTVRTKWMVKNTRVKLRTNPRCSATKLAAEAALPDFDAPHP